MLKRLKLYQKPLNSNLLGLQIRRIIIFVKLLHYFSFDFPLLSTVVGCKKKKKETVRIKLAHYYGVKPCKREVRIMIKIQ
jgi:hypothetical protein